MTCEELWAAFRAEGLDFFTGVPDSTFAPWMAFLSANNGQGLTDLAASNEGEAVALAAGYHLATGKVGVVYMQNAGLGNTVNPLTSLADPEVYAIPMILMIGWRGQPGRKDEPQHVKMGRVMRPLLDALEIPWRDLPAAADPAAAVIAELRALALRASAPVALIVRSGIVEGRAVAPASDRSLTREQALEWLLELLPAAAVSVATTGKTSREVFEIRERRGEGHERDFLTVGSMGLASAIALGVALQKPGAKVVILDGDGAMLMHTGNLAAIGRAAPANLYHVVFDNGVHDSTGGQRLASASVDFGRVAEAFGYAGGAAAETEDELKAAARSMLAGRGPFLLTVRVRPGARKDLGRPTTTPVRNKTELMKFLGALK
ncbi:MAG TPA: phosphonopyruvate decarboxylase [Kiritimatiellia bacterium]|nr:phosphonopyruvate decarboxylase [Kiritimatiellia bacterium]HRZ12564.1 phosphonopyruvate decarboxylase [Kiritimatiellia bacterium]HSA17642.1 phosphonopyruvate decarboxylase [Kiritimatiellia bacterium]